MDTCNQPKRRKPAYFFFFLERKGTSEVTNELLGQIIEEWKELLDKGETEKYDKLALEDRERYEKEMAAWEKIKKPK